MYTNSTTYRKNMFKKVLPTLVAISVFSVFVWIITGVVVTVLNTTTGKINVTVIDGYSTATDTTAVTEQYTITAHSTVETPTTYHASTSTTSTSATTTTTLTTSLTLRSTHNLSTVPSTTQSATSVFTTLFTTSIIPKCLLNNVELVIEKSCWVRRTDVKGCRYTLSRQLTQVIVSETQTSNCHGTEDCLSLLRMIMSNHLQQSYRDINYNFIISGDGLIYEGRSWNCKVEDNLQPSSKTIHVAFTGNPADEVNDEQISSLQELLSYGYNNSYFKYNYKLTPYCCVISSNNPSKYVFDLIKSDFSKFASNCKTTTNCKWKI